MNKDVECPYCDKWQEVDHDDSHGYEEDVDHEQECADCNKTFVFITSISYSYASNKADCLNGSDHKLEMAMTHPRQYSIMHCADCGYSRTCTKEEIEALPEKELENKSFKDSGNKIDKPELLEN